MSRFKVEVAYAKFMNWGWDSDCFPPYYRFDADNEEEAIDKAIKMFNQKYKGRASEYLFRAINYDNIIEYIYNEFDERGKYADNKSALETIRQHYCDITNKMGKCTIESMMNINSFDEITKQIYSTYDEFVADSQYIIPAYVAVDTQNGIIKVRYYKNCK